MTQIIKAMAVHLIFLMAQLTVGAWLKSEAAPTAKALTQNWQQRGPLPHPVVVAGAAGIRFQIRHSKHLTKRGPLRIKQGQSLTRYEVKPGDVLVADRGLAHRRGIGHVVSHGGDVIVRMNLTNVPLQDQAGQDIKLLPWLRKLKVGKAADLPAWIRDEQRLIPVRVCAIKKSAAQTRKAQDKVRKESAKDKREAQPQTLEVAGYVVVLSTLMQPSAHTLLELYRCRWQVELAFKRLKSLLQFGHLKKTDPQGAKAWLQGKLLVAGLIETLIAVDDHFSPWGYYLSPTS